MRRTLSWALALPALGLAFIGCGQQEPVTTPVACLEGTQEWLDSLKVISDEGSGPTDTQVLIGDETPISDCIPPDQPAGQQETVGKTAVEVATYLSQAVRSTGNLNMDGEWTFAFEPAKEAGYLVGALERGSERSQGIHATLVERVRSAATNGLDRMSNNEQDEYKLGYESGLQSG